MAVSANDSFLTQLARDYAALSDLAYANWENENGQWVPKGGVLDFGKYEDLWRELYLSGYRFIDQKKNDDITGYSGTLFVNTNTNRIILANRGTDDPKDTAADDAILLDGKTPSGQFRSMVDYIEQLRRDEIIMGEFDVTGHSLGGTLSQMAKAAYSETVNTVYTFNAMGAQNLTRDCFIQSSTTGYVVVEREIVVLGQTIRIPEQWSVSSWAYYESFFQGQANVDASKVYNISSKDMLSLWSNGGGKDIGPEVFINGSWHSIASVRNNLRTSPFYVDARNNITIVGSNKAEAIVGGYNRQSNDGDPVGKLTFVGGYGNDRLQGWNGNDELYGDLPAELAPDAIKAANR